MELSTSLKPVLACTPDGKVCDRACSKQFAIGLLEVKCPETKFLMNPLDDYSDPTFLVRKQMENVN